MKSQLTRFALIGGLTMAMCSFALAGQKNTKGSPQAKPTTHVTQGTIASIDDSKLVIDRKGKGKDKQMTVMLDPQTQRSGNLAVGSRVSVQYREENSQMMATAVREVASKSASKPAKTGTKPASKS